MRACVGVAAGLFLCASAISADGGRLRAVQDAGAFRVAIFTQPEPLVAGPADVSVLVQDRQTNETLLDAGVTLAFSGPDGASKTVVAGRRAGNRLFYAARVDLTAGAWTATARVRRRDASGEVHATLDVVESSGAFSPWPYLAIPPLAVGLFALNRRLRRRRLATAALAILCVWGTSGCSYLKWRQDRSKGLAERATGANPRAQAVATGMAGFGETHVGFPSDKAALAELSRVLDETCARKEPEK